MFTQELSRVAVQHWLVTAARQARRDVFAVLKRVIRLAGSPPELLERLDALEADAELDVATAISIGRLAMLDTPSEHLEEVEALVSWCRIELWTIYAFEEADVALRTGLLAAVAPELDPAVTLAAALRAGAYEHVRELASTVSSAALAKADPHFVPHLACATASLKPLLAAVATGETPIATAVAACHAAAS